MTPEALTVSVGSVLPFEIALCPDNDKTFWTFGKTKFKQTPPYPYGYFQLIYLSYFLFGVALDNTKYYVVVMKKACYNCIYSV